MTNTRPRRPSSMSVAESPNTRFVSLLRIMPNASSSFVIVVGCLVLAGWVFDIAALKSMLPGLVTMKANTAIAFILSGISLKLLSHQNRSRRKLSQILAIVVMLIGLLTLSQYLFGWNFHIDQLLLQEPVGAPGTSHLGRMAPSTALNFFLTGGALWLLSRSGHRSYGLAQILTLLAALVAWQAFIGYVYRVEALYRIDSYTQMSLHTVVTLLVLCTGILGIGADCGFMRFIANDRISGFIARRLLLAAVITPTGLGWLVVQGVRTNLISGVFGLSLLVVVSTLVFVVLIWRTVEILDHRDGKRQQAETALLASESRFRCLVESNILGVAFVRLSGKITYANDAFLEMVGYTQDELLQGDVRWDTMTPPEYLPLDQHSAEELRTTGVFTPFEKEYIRKDGSRVPVLLGGALFQKSLAQSQEVVCFYLDLSEAKRLEAARRQTELELRRANDRFERAAAAVKGVIYDWDLITDRVERTQGLMDVIGFSPQEVEPTRDWWKNRIHPDDLIRLNQISEKTLATNAYVVEYRIRHRDGQYRYVWDRALLEHNADGQIVRAVGFTLDVTERYRAEAALRESEARFQLMADTAPVLIWMSGEDKRGTYFNRRWLDFTGRTLEQEVGEGWLEGIYPDDKQDCFTTCTTAFNTRQSFTVEFRLRRFDGEYRWVLDTGIPRYTPDGRFSGYIGSCIDITDRKQAEAAQTYLAEANKVLFSSLDYQTTLASLTELTVPRLADLCTVMILEEDGSAQPLATACVDATNATWLQELRQKYPFNSNDPYGVAHVFRTGQSQLYPSISDALLVESARTDEHLEILRQANLRSAMIVPLSARGKTLGAISFFYTTSERCYSHTDLVLAEELAHRAALAVDNARLYRAAQHDRAVSETARSAAEAANRSKDEFLSILSHELRTPLHSMMGWTQMLKTRNLNGATVERALEIVDRNTRSLATIVEDLLDVSRIITGKLRLHLCPVELLPIIELAIDTVASAAEAKDIKLTVLLDESTSPSSIFVLGDPDRLQQIVWNLLSNAVKFTPEGGQVQVRLLQVGTGGPETNRLNQLDSTTSTSPSFHAQIQVIDTGIGIRPGFLPHIFDRFQQADSSTTRSYGGLGLGLAIVRHLIEMHNGSIAVESVGEGQGSTFIVNLPATIPAAKPTLSNLPASAPNQAIDNSVNQPANEDTSSLNGLRILVVDDEADARHLLSTILTAHGAAVAACDSAASALKILSSDAAGAQPDILISDIGMPEEDGYTLIRKIRQSDGIKHIPAVALTAYARSEDYAQSLQAGFQQHMSKPVNADELVETIATLVDQHSNSKAH